MQVSQALGTLESSCMARHPDLPTPQEKCSYTEHCCAGCRGSGQAQGSLQLEGPWPVPSLLGNQLLPCVRPADGTSPGECSAERRLLCRWGKHIHACIYKKAGGRLSRREEKRAQTAEGYTGRLSCGNGPHSSSLKISTEQTVKGKGRLILESYALVVSALWGLCCFA